MPNITQRQVKTALDKAGGIITTRNPIETLMYHMGIKYGPNSSPVEQVLDTLVDKNKLVVIREEGYVVLIATSKEYLTYEIEQEEKANAMVTAKPGRRHTTHPQNHDGSWLPAHLSDDQCGPVTISYRTKGVEDTITAAAELVIEKLRESVTQTGKVLMARSGIEYIIKAIAEVEDEKPIVVEAIIERVFSYLTTYKILVRSGGHTGKDPVYEVRLPKLPENSEATPPEEPTREELTERLLRRCEELKRQVDKLTEQNTTANTATAEATRLKNDAEAALAAAQTEFEKQMKDTVSPEVLNKTVARAEQFAREKNDAEAKLAEAQRQNTSLKTKHESDMNTAQTRHRNTIDAMANNHRTVVKDIQRQLDEATAEIERLQRETGTPKIDDEMQKRLKALNIEF